MGHRSRKFIEERSLERDLAWIVILATFFGFGLAISWQRWGNPLIDTGREMNQPLRLIGGEMLYSDIRHLYGPLSPFLHALLFQWFGPSLTVLYTDGIVTAVTILAIVYWLARQIMAPLGAAAATLTVMSLCVFKPAGNYILPYSYNALHGAALGLITLAILISALKRERPTIKPFVIAGIVTGLTCLAKTEMGLAALAAGIAGALLATYPDLRRGAVFAAALVTAAAGLTAGVYALIAARVGWSTLLLDNWLLLYNVPPELTTYNSWVSGFDNPVKSVRRMIIAAIKLGVVAAIIAAISSIVAAMKSGGEEKRTPAARGWRLLSAALVIALVTSVTIGLDVDKGPYLAMPFLLVGILIALAARFRANPATRPSTDTAILITCTVYAFASLARMILHVRSGGAYGSYLLPMSVVMFTYMWVEPFAKCFGDERTRRVARNLALALIIANAVITTGILGFRYRTRNTVPIVTERGAMIAEADVGQAWNEALAYISRSTKPGDAVAVIPEGTSLNFLGERRHPLRDEITIPGILDPAAESQAIQRLQDAHTRLILITNRPTGEFGPAAFGRDYGQRLMRWIERDYTACAMFGPIKDPALQIGDAPFFIRGYCPSHAAVSSTGR